MKDALREELRWILPATAVALSSAGFMAAKTARDALYFQDDSLSSLPVALMLIALLGIPQARLVLAGFARFGTRLTRVMLQWTVAASLAVYVPFADPGATLLNGTFFVALPLLFTVLFSATWLLTADLFDGCGPERTTRAYHRVTVASMVGGTLGAGLAERLGPSTVPRGLVVVAVFSIAIAALVTTHAQRTFPHRPLSESEAERSAPTGMREVMRSGYARLLLIISAAGAFAGVMIEFLFYADAASANRGPEASTSYFGSVYFLIQAGALLLHLLLGVRLQRFAGLAGMLLVLPLTLLGGGSALLFGGGHLLQAGVRVAEGGLRASIHRSGWEQAFVGIARPARPIAKVVVDGLASRVSAGFAALLLFGWLTFVVHDPTTLTQTHWIDVAIVVSTSLWVLATLALRRLLRRCSLEPHASMPSSLPDGCPTTAILGERAVRTS